MIYLRECSMCTWEERVFCCCWVECSVYICYSPFVLKCHWSPIFPYGFFCLESLSIIVSEVLKSPTISALLSISACRAVNIYLIYVVALMLGTYIYKCYILLINWFLYHYIMTLLSLVIDFDLHFVWYKYNCPALFWFPSAWNICYHPSVSAYVCH